MTTTTKTTEARHTPEPWAVHEWGSPGSGRRFGIETADQRHGLAAIAPNETASTMLSMDEHRANAHRIVACVNACAGIADPSVVPELLVALEKCVAELGHATNIQTVAEELGRAAIAKAKGA